ncbi:MAG TPA: RNA methyltransferase [Thermoanaerobaculia bacterium]|jgi:TrmH family RNA methyltransferase
MAETWQAPAVVLVRPREEGNVGSAARAMANMGLERLILVEPAAPTGEIATRFAVGAGHLLAAAERAPSVDAALAPFSRIVATTSARDRRLALPLLVPRQLPAFLAADPPGTPTALLFGPEIGGLNNDELARASAVVNIPCSPRQPTLNLAQAVLVLAYELYAGSGSPAAGAAAAAPEPLASASEIEGLFGHAREALTRAGFDRDSSFPGVLRDLRQLAARAALSEREVRMLRGICRRLLGAMGKVG